jgi:hypothetical protein
LLRQSDAESGIVNVLGSSLSHVYLYNILLIFDNSKFAAERSVLGRSEKTEGPTRAG